MSLQTWADDGLLVPHKTTRVEIANFLAMAQHDLEQCRLEGLSPGWRLNIAYSGLLQAATAALAAAIPCSRRRGPPLRRPSIVGFHGRLR